MGEVDKVICVIGLGYVGLPLSLEFAKVGLRVVGFDLNVNRVKDLQNDFDSKGEFTSEQLKIVNIEFTSVPEQIRQADFVFVCVPTPITEAKTPDLGPLKSASEIVGRNLKKGSIVVFESTVYPGVTEDVCLPLLEEFSGLKCPVEFKVAYSPERINPGDTLHTLDKVVKVVSGIDDVALEEVSFIYSLIAKAGVHKAPNIKTAEASKLVENVQRDLNISLMNELALIFSRIGIKTKDVLEAAGTKWNFHKYYPGLVGGHCISVDPYYLTFKAEQLGYHPRVVLAGRFTNDFFPRFIAQMALKELNRVGKVLQQSHVLILGLTYKETVQDVRNSKAIDVVKALQEYNVIVKSYEPNLSQEEITRLCGIKNVDLESVSNIDCVILVNKHKQFETITLDYLKTKMSLNPIVIDLKSLFNEKEAVEKGFIYKCL